VWMANIWHRTDVKFFSELEMPSVMCNEWFTHKKETTLNLVNANNFHSISVAFLMKCCLALETQKCEWINRYFIDAFTLCCAVLPMFKQTRQSVSSIHMCQIDVKQIFSFSLTRFPLMHSNPSIQRNNENAISYAHICVCDTTHSHFRQINKLK
jgi:hypothetical protein